MASTGKYFMVELTPTIKATAQHEGRYGVGDVLFDVNSASKIQIPSGPARLIGATALIRSQASLQGALSSNYAQVQSTPKPNNFGLDLVFSTEERADAYSAGNRVYTLGLPDNDVIGSVRLSAGDYIASSLGSCTSIVSTGDKPGNIVLNRGPQPCTVVADRANGYDTYYVGGIANGAFNWKTRNQIEEAGFAAGTQTVITMGDGTGGSSGMVLERYFLPGDKLVAHDGAVLGTVSTVDSATQLTLTAANTDAIEHDDYIYNENPIRIKLFFER